MKRLMDEIVQTVKGRIAETKLSPLEDKTRKHILREFANDSYNPDGVIEFVAKWKGVVVLRKLCVFL